MDEQPTKTEWTDLCAVHVNISGTYWSAPLGHAILVGQAVSDVTTYHMAAPRRMGQQDPAKYGNRRSGFGDNPGRSDTCEIRPSRAPAQTHHGESATVRRKPLCIFGITVRTVEPMILNGTGPKQLEGSQPTNVH